MLLFAGDKREMKVRLEVELVEEMTLVLVDKLNKRACMVPSNV
jgi:hypothetical protein